MGKLFIVIRKVGTIIAELKFLFVMPISKFSGLETHAIIVYIRRHLVHGYNILGRISWMMSLRVEGESSGKKKAKRNEIRVQPHKT